MRAALYVRVSSDKQVREGDSIPAQLDALHKYAKEHNYQIIGTFVDDGISGTKSDRDELQNLLKLVESDQVDMLLCTKMDRLHRSLRNFLNMQDILDKHHCHWKAIFEPTYDTSTPQGRMVVNMLMNLAEFEAGQTSDRIRQVQAYKVQKREVISGKCTPGYVIKDKHLVVDPDKGDAVRLCFDTFLRTGSLTAAGKAVEGMGLPRSNNGIKQMLKREVYTGRAYGIDDFCEPIIDRATFEEVQRLLPLNVKSNTRKVYLFSGLLRCKECGCVMAAWTRVKGKRRPTALYRCPRHYQRVGHYCENPKQVTEAVLERKLLAMLPDLVVKQVEIEEDRKRISVDVEKQRKTIERKIDRLKDLYINELIDLEEYRADKERLLADLDALEDVQSPSESSENALLGLVGMNVAEIYQTFDKSEKRLFWRSLIKTIYFDMERNFYFDFLGSTK